MSPIRTISTLNIEKTIRKYWFNVRQVLFCNTWYRILLER